MCFFKVKHYFGHISGLVGPIDVKRKGSALVGYWVQYVTLTFDLTQYLDVGCFKVKFRNSSISGIVGLIDLKWKRKWVNIILGRLYDLAFDHTHDLDLGVEIWRSESEVALSQEWDGRLTSVTMVGWADVPNSDWGDFRRRRAVDISSLDMSHACMHVMQTFMIVIALSVFAFSSAESMNSPQTQLTQWHILPVQPTVFVIW